MPLKNKEKHRLYMIEYNRQYRKRPEIREKRNMYLRQWRLRKKEERIQRERNKELRVLRREQKEPIGDIDDPFSFIQALGLEEIA